ncbi:LysR family transcriptional regulator [Povalibacter sp.]|uniref:LysR family transcriptional regulator n=1 Tax=Povalibacter sp. TaxID=1962978 RepID=UPI002F40EFAE
MIKLEGIETFVAAAEQGSLSEAARVLGLSKSIVSERLAELEREVGARLIQRTTRRMTVTEDGLAFLERARRIAREVSEAAAELAERRGELVGSLRVSGPVSFGYLHLGPALYPFLQQHRGIELTLDLDDRFADVEAGGYDAVIRHGAVRESWLVAIRLAPSRRMLVASPGYLEANGVPTSLADLDKHKAILYSNRATDWRFTAASGDIVVHPPRALRVNNGLIMRDAATAGMGVTLLPSFMVHAEIKSGKLCKVDIGLEPERAEIHLAYPKGHRPSAKLRALTDHLRRVFGDPPYWDLA